MASDLISQPALTKRLGVKPVTVHRWRKRPDLGFPAAIKIGDRVFFNLAEVEFWIAAKTASRPALKGSE